MWEEEKTRKKRKEDMETESKNVKKKRAVMAKGNEIKMKKKRCMQSLSQSFDEFAPWPSLYVWQYILFI